VAIEPVVYEEPPVEDVVPGQLVEYEPLVGDIPTIDVLPPAVETAVEEAVLPVTELVIEEAPPLLDSAVLQITSPFAGLVIEKAPPSAESTPPVEPKYEALPARRVLFVEPMAGHIDAPAETIPVDKPAPADPDLLRRILEGEVELRRSKRPVPSPPPIPVLPPSTHRAPPPVTRPMEKLSAIDQFLELMPSQSSEQPVIAAKDMEPMAPLTSISAMDQFLDLIGVEIQESGSPRPAADEGAVIPLPAEMPLERMSALEHFLDIMTQSGDSFAPAPVENGSAINPAPDAGEAPLERMSALDQFLDVMIQSSAPSALAQVGEEEEATAFPVMATEVPLQRVSAIDQLLDLLVPEYGQPVPATAPEPEAPAMEAAAPLPVAMVPVSPVIEPATSIPLPPPPRRRRQKPAITPEDLAADVMAGVSGRHRPAFSSTPSTPVTSVSLVPGEPATCFCGKPALFTMHVIADGAKPEEEAGRPIGYTVRDLFIHYALDCGHHLVPLTPALTAIPEKELHEWFIRSLPLHRFEFQIFEQKFDRDRFLIVLGRHAADLLAHPALAKGLLEKARKRACPASCMAWAASSHALMFYPQTVSRKNLVRAQEVMNDLASRYYPETGEIIASGSRITLSDEAQGEFGIIFHEVSQ